MKNSYVLVTGASSGIGLKIAQIFAEKGYNIILTARRKDKLKEFAESISNSHKVKVDFIPSDLSDPAAPQDIYNFCKNNNYQIDILVNNAGYGIKTPFHETSMEDEEKFIERLLWIFSNDYNVYSFNSFSFFVKSVLMFDYQWYYWHLFV